MVRRNGRVTFSHRTTLAHWLIRTGRARHDWIHFWYVTPMMVSEVGRTISFFEFLGAALGHPRHLRREPLDVLGLLEQQALGDEQREVGVDMPGGLEAVVELPLDLLPDGIAVGRMTMQPLTGE